MRSLLLLSLLSGAVQAAEGRAPAQADVAVQESSDTPSAELAVRDGKFLPQTVSAAIDDRRASGLFFGGYDGGPLHGGSFTSALEVGIFHRFAVLASIAYLNPVAQVSPSVGARVGILTQARNRVDLSAGVTYNHFGFSESSGEFELSLAVAHRWQRVSLIGNAIYGQGINPSERDVEGRIALLLTAHQRINIGLDFRARADLGDDNANRIKNSLESDFDLAGGPVCLITVTKHLVALAQVGLHTALQKEVVATGAVAFAGVGATY